MTSETKLTELKRAYAAWEEAPPGKVATRLFREVAEAAYALGFKRPPKGHPHPGSEIVLFARRTLDGPRP